MLGVARNAAIGVLSAVVGAGALAGCGSGNNNAPNGPTPNAPTPNGGAVGADVDKSGDATGTPTNSVTSKDSAAKATPPAVPDLTPEEFKAIAAEVKLSPKVAEALERAHQARVQERFNELYPDQRVPQQIDPDNTGMITLEINKIVTEILSRRQFPPQDVRGQWTRAEFAELFRELPIHKPEVMQQLLKECSRDLGIASPAMFFKARCADHQMIDLIFTNTSPAVYPHWYLQGPHKAVAELHTLLNPAPVSYGSVALPTEVDQVKVINFLKPLSARELTQVAEEYNTRARLRGEPALVQALVQNIENPDLLVRALIMANGVDIYGDARKLVTRVEAQDQLIAYLATYREVSPQEQEKMINYITQLRKITGEEYNKFIPGLILERFASGANTDSEYIIGAAFPVTLTPEGEMIYQDIASGSTIQLHLILDGKPMYYRDGVATAFSFVHPDRTELSQAIEQASEIIGITRENAMLTVVGLDPSKDGKFNFIDNLNSLLEQPVPEMLTSLEGLFKILSTRQVETMQYLYEYRQLQAGITEPVPIVGTVMDQFADYIVLPELTETEITALNDQQMRTIVSQIAERIPTDTLERLHSAVSDNNSEALRLALVHTDGKVFEEATISSLDTFYNYRYGSKFTESIAADNPLIQLLIKHQIDVKTAEPNAVVQAVIVEYGQNALDTAANILTLISNRDYVAARQAIDAIQGSDLNINAVVRLLRGGKPETLEQLKEGFPKIEKSKEEEEG